MLKLWDTRMPNSPSNHYMGHNGPTFAIDWHPEEKNWVASAGRDKMVKVMSTPNLPAKFMSLFLVWSQLLPLFGDRKWDFFQTEAVNKALLDLYLVHWNKISGNKRYAFYSLWQLTLIDQCFVSRLSVVTRICIQIQILLPQKSTLQSSVY